MIKTGTNPHKLHRINLCAHCFCIVASHTHTNTWWTMTCSKFHAQNTQYYYENLWMYLHFVFVHTACNKVPYKKKQAHRTAADKPSDQNAWHKMNAMRSQKYIKYIRCFIRYSRFRLFVNGCARLLVRFFLFCFLFLLPVLNEFVFIFSDDSRCKYQLRFFVNVVVVWANVRLRHQVLALFVCFCDMPYDDCHLSFGSVSDQSQL